MKTAKTGTGRWRWGRQDGRGEFSSVAQSADTRRSSPNFQSPIPYLQSLLLFPFYFFLFTSTASGLPGQSTDAVTAWINAHPTLRSGIGDGLLVNRNNSAARRFSFQATVLPPGRISTPIDRGTIRSERISFYDSIDGVTFNQLQESLRVIYGSALYQDFERANLVYDYPAPETADLARRRNLPLLEKQQGRILLGERYAYWMEVTQTDTGKAFNGQLTVFLKEDLDKLEAELRDR